MFWGSKRRLLTRYRPNNGHTSSKARRLARLLGGAEEMWRSRLRRLGGWRLLRKIEIHRYRMEICRRHREDPDAY